MVTHHPERNETMSPTLNKEFAGRWPTWFNTGGDVRHTLMPWGFCQGEGWFDILWRLCGDLEPLVAEFEQAAGCQFEVLQVLCGVGLYRWGHRAGIGGQLAPVALAAHFHQPLPTQVGRGCKRHNSPLPVPRSVLLPQICSHGRRQFVLTLSNITSKSAGVLLPTQFAGNTFALRLLKGDTAAAASEIV